MALVVALSLGGGCAALPQVLVATVTPTRPATPTPVPPTATSTRAPSPTATRTSTPPPTATHPATATSTRTATPRPSPTPVPAVVGPPVPRSTGSLIVGANPATGVAALTFDAGGRDPGGTAAVLDALEQYGVRVTIFLTGEWAAANPALVQRMAAAGHELANHTYDHPHLTQVADREILAQLARTEAAVRQVAGVELKRYVRPPFGEYDQRVLNVLAGSGYEGVFWTIDGGDWRDDVSAAEVEQRVATQTGPGHVVVMHIYAAKTGQAIPAILARLKARGVQLGTLSQALGR